MTDSPNNTSLTKQALTRALFFSALAIPTLISITVAFQLKTLKSGIVIAEDKEPQIVCFEPNVCAIEVYGKWYRIDGVIIMDETVPDEYRLNDLLKDPVEPTAGINPKAGAKALGSIVDSVVTPSPSE